MNNTTSRGTPIQKAASASQNATTNCQLSILLFYLQPFFLRRIVTTISAKTMPHTSPTMDHLSIRPWKKVNKPNIRLAPARTHKILSHISIYLLVAIRRIG